MGRENVILLLEHDLLPESNPGVPWDRSGTGETALLKFLTLWWRMTNFITGTIWFDAFEMDTQKLPRFLRHAILGGSEASQEELVEKLFDTTILFCSIAGDLLIFPRFLLFLNKSRS